MPKPTRFSALTDPFYAAASKIGTSTSDYFRQAAVYNLDLESNATWKDISKEVSSRIFRTAPSNIM